MDLQSIGESIRSYRKKRKWRQEDLAEKVDLSVNYISLLERGEKIPALDTFIDIVNVLGVTSDMVLTDVLDTGYQIKAHSWLIGSPSCPRRIGVIFWLLSIRWYATQKSADDKKLMATKRFP